MTQTDDILDALKQGQFITPLDALRDFGCMRLGARVWELRQRGIPVQSRLVVSGGKRFSEYYLEEGER